jgi:hypothetical protein
MIDLIWANIHLIEDYLWRLNIKITEIKWSEDKKIYLFCVDNNKIVPYHITIALTRRFKLGIRTNADIDKEDLIKYIKYNIVRIESIKLILE